MGSSVEETETPSCAVSPMLEDFEAGSDNATDKLKENPIQAEYLKDFLRKKQQSNNFYSDMLTQLIDDLDKIHVASSEDMQKKDDVIKEIQKIIYALNEDSSRFSSVIRYMDNDTKA